MLGRQILQGQEIMNQASVIPLPNIVNNPIRHIPIKRIFDICFSAVVLTLGLPVYLLLALAVKITSKGPVFFRHERIGRGGRRFLCYKFRTMHPDAEKRLSGLLASDPRLRKEWETHYKLKKDPRITPIGSFLRKTSLDELPQFWNVFIGDLSVVGPRPVTEEELKKKVGPYAARFLTIRPGLTGPWQVSGRSETNFCKRIRLDMHYIRYQSFLWDLTLILRTVPAMLSTRGAY